MHWDYLKRWTNFRRQLSKHHVTPKIIFYKNKEITQNSAQNRFSVISMTSSGHSNKACIHCSTQKHIFIFFTSILRYQRFMSFKEGLPLYQLFSLCIMFGMHFDNVSVLLNSVAAASVHLATSSVTITCGYVHTAKLEIHQYTRLKWSEANWHYNKVDSTH